MLPPLAEELRVWTSKLPGVLAVCDLANFKAVNDALGHRVGDHIIEGFETALRRLLGSRAEVLRICGEEWAALLPPGHGPELDAFLIGFTRSYHIGFGWKAVARSKEKMFELKVVSPARVVVAVRCVYAYVASSDQLAPVIDAIYAKFPSSPAGRALHLDDVRQTSESKHQTLQYEHTPIYCPVCHSKDFRWEDGDGTTYGGEGMCNGCGSKIRFSDCTVNSLGY